MRKLTFLFTTLLLSVIFVASSCKKSNDGSSAKYLTESAFASSTWTGTDSEGYEVTLSVTSKSNMTHTYYATSISKNTDEKTEKRTVKIEYKFNESTGKWEGTGDDNFDYSGSLTSTNQMTLLMSKGSITMTKE